MKKNLIIKSVFLFLLVSGMMGCGNGNTHTDNGYKEISRPTKKIGKGRNDVKGIILHHTAEDNIQNTLGSLCDSKRPASTHVIIDKDGTRYILAKPEDITWHAGHSILNGRERCNEFTIGIEFQGNTKVAPLTEDQINSALEYIIPNMRKYNIPKENIVTHEKVRHDWIVKHPDLAKGKKVREKVDITQKEYERFMEALEAQIQQAAVPQS